jgi:Tol biopolymer transport system component
MRRHRLVGLFLLVAIGATVATTACAPLATPQSENHGSSTATGSVEPSAPTLPTVQSDDIAFVRSEQIWIVRANGDAPVLVTPGVGSYYAPAWSPDHTELAFVQSADINFAETSTVSVIASGGRPRSWTLDMSVFSLCFSPDGRRLALIGSQMSDPDGSDEWQLERLAILDLESGRTEVVYELHDLFATWFTVSWSPDGSRVLLAEAMQDAEDQRMGVFTLETRKLRWLKTRDVVEAHWSSDGASILASQAPQSYSAVAVTDADGRVRRTVIKGGGWDGPKAPVFSGCFSPDASRIAYCDGTGIWVVNLDGTGGSRIIRDAEQPAWSAR